MRARCSPPLPAPDAMTHAQPNRSMWRGARARAVADGASLKVSEVAVWCVPPKRRRMLRAQGGEGWRGLPWWLTAAAALPPPSGCATAATPFHAIQKPSIMHMHGPTSLMPHPHIQAQAIGAQHARATPPEQVHTRRVPSARQGEERAPPLPLPLPPSLVLACHHWRALSGSGPAAARAREGSGAPPMPPRRSQLTPARARAAWGRRDHRGRGEVRSRPRRGWRRGSLRAADGAPRAR